MSWWANKTGRASKCATKVVLKQSFCDGANVCVHTHTHTHTRAPRKTARYPPTKIGDPGLPLNIEQDVTGSKVAVHKVPGGQIVHPFADLKSHPELCLGAEGIVVCGTTQELGEETAVIAEGHQ